MKLLCKIIDYNRFMKVTGAQIIVVVYFPITFAVCAVLYDGTTGSSDILICGFQICVNQWKLTFRNEAFSGLLLLWGGRLLMMHYVNERWASMEFKNT
jgi:hypothetical protein